jgi:hypothetical protein
MGESRRKEGEEGEEGLRRDESRLNLADPRGFVKKLAGLLYSRYATRLPQDFFSGYISRILFSNLNQTILHPAVYNQNKHFCVISRKLQSSTP